MKHLLPFSLFFPLVLGVICCHSAGVKPVQEVVDTLSVAELGEEMFDSIKYLSPEEYLKLEMDSVFPVCLQKLPLRIINHTSNQIELSRSAYQLYYYNVATQRWENALPDDYAYLMIADVALPDDTLFLEIFEYTQKPGKYLVIKEISTTYEYNNQTRHYKLYKEFVLKP